MSVYVYKNKSKDEKVLVQDRPHAQVIHVTNDLKSSIKVRSSHLCVETKKDDNQSCLFSFSFLIILFSIVYLVTLVWVYKEAD